MNNKLFGAEAQGAGNAVTSQNLAITIYTSDVFGKIRTAGTPDNPMFCLADIGRVLEIKNIRDCKSKLKQDGVEEIYIIDSMGRPQQAAFINEQNLYKLIMRSNKPQAEPFQDWVCGEVLPQIRKTGGYIPISEHDDDLTVMAKALRIMQRTLEEKENLIEQKNALIGSQAEKIGDQAETIEEQAVTIAQLQPKANVFDEIVLSDGTYTATQLAKEFGYPTVRDFYNKLTERRILYQQSGTYMPYKDWTGKDLFAWRTRRIKHKDGKIEVKTYLVFTEKFRAAILYNRHKRALESL